MLPHDHPLAPLQAEDALASGWPELLVEAPDEALLDRARAAVESVLGPCPQIEVIEPWDSQDAEEPWELRCRLPELTVEDWRRLDSSLAAIELGAVLRRAGLPGVSAAIELGHRESDPIEAGGIVAALWFDADDGGVVAPELARVTPDAAHAALEVSLVDVVRKINPGFHFYSDAGTDTAEPVVDVATGRRGLSFVFSSDQVDALPGDDLHALREGLVGGFAELITSLSRGSGARLAPDLLWDTRLGLGFVLWWVGPPASHLPSDDAIPDGVFPDADTLERLARQPAAEAIEVHVVPRATAAHEAVVEAVVAAATAAGWPLTGAAPRWVRRASGEAVFTPVWLVPAAAPLAELGRALAALPGVVAVRFVPGEPVDAGDTWSQADPGWWWRHGRCVRRVRDGLWEEDRLPGLRERPRSEADARLENALGSATLTGGAWVTRDDGHLGRPVRTADGADALVCALSPSPREPVVWRALVDVLARLRAPGLGPVIDVATGRGATRVLLRHLGPAR